MARRGQQSESDAEKNAPGEGFEPDGAGGEPELAHHEAVEPDQAQGERLSDEERGYRAFLDEVAIMSLGEQQTLLTRLEKMSVALRGAISQQSAEVKTRDEQSRTFLHKPCKKKMLLTRAAAAAAREGGDVGAFCSLCGRKAKATELKPLFAAEG